MSYFRQSIDEQIQDSTRALTNASAEPEILALLSLRSYDAAKLAQGLALTAEVRRLQQEIERHEGIQKGASKAVTEARRRARDVYGPDMELARAALAEDEGLLAELGLDEPRETVVDRWIEQALGFYANALANPAIVERLTPYGLNAAALEKGRAAIRAVEAARAEHLRRIGAKEEVARLARVARANHDKYMRPFWKVARVALKDHPQWLEKLGVRVRS